MLCHKMGNIDFNLPVTILIIFEWEYSDGDFIDKSWESPGVFRVVVHFGYNVGWGPYFVIACEGLDGIRRVLWIYEGLAVEEVQF